MVASIEEILDGQFSVEDRYEMCAAMRQPYLRRARDCAKLTIPTLIPDEATTASTDFPTPFQSIGARGVNHLASKLLITLLPPSSPFFRLIVDDYDLSQMPTQMSRGQVEEGLSRAERAVMSEIETGAIRVPVFEALKHLLVAGNVLIFLPEDKGMRVFPIDRYTVKRDASGNILEIIVKETVSPTMLEDDVRELIGGTEDEYEPTKECDLYTYVCNYGDYWHIHQEIQGNLIPDSVGSYKPDRFPWIPLMFESVDGEDYGRGHVEQYYGDLRSLEALTQAIVEGSAAASKVVFLVRPNGTTNPRDIAEAPNGAIVQGDENDVSTLQMDKFQDFRVSELVIGRITERLSYAFLLNSSVRRDAERVTAEEIRYMAQELESSLGGTYSLLSTDFQLPLVRLVLDRLSKGGKLPDLPEIVKPQIVAGLEGLGRGYDLNRLQMLLQYLQPFGPDALMSEMNLSDYIDRLGASLGIDMLGLLKTPEQKQMEAQQRQAQMEDQRLMALYEKATPEVAKQLLPQILGTKQQG